MERWRKALAVGLLALAPGCKRAPAAPPAPAAPAPSPAAEPPPEPAAQDLEPRRDAGDGALLDVVDLARAKTFTSLKEARAHRESAVKLSLEGQSLTRVPGLGELQALQALDLSRNNLSDLPRLGALSRLQQLDLSDNPFRRPPEIGGLGELTELDLSRTQLSTLPFEVGKLKKLRVLRVGSERLKRLPEELTDAVALTTLSLRGCRQIDKLPQEMGKLQSLSSLDLTGTAVPVAEIERVKNLLPKLTVVGGAEEPGPDAAEDGAGAPRSAASTLELRCPEVVKLGWREYLKPVVADGAEEPGSTGLEQAVQRFTDCVDQETTPAREALDARMSARLDAVERSLQAFEEARFDLWAIDGDESQVDRAKLIAEAARAAVKAEVLPALSDRSRDAARPAPGEAAVRRAVAKVAEASAAGPEADAAAALQEAQDGLLRLLEGMPPPARAPVLRRMLEVLEP